MVISDMTAVALKQMQQPTDAQPLLQSRTRLQRDSADAQRLSVKSLLTDAVAD